MRLSIKEINALQDAIISAITSANFLDDKFNDAELRNLYIKLASEKKDIEFEENKQLY